MDLTKLHEPFPPDRVSWRVGSTNADKTRGMALAYIDARDVQDRLDAVCGAENWGCSYELLGSTTVCTISIRCDGASSWVSKADGAGATDVEGEKGALSDAFKRAGVKWGIGRYLYDLDSPWVPIETHGKSSKITAEGMKQLRALLAGKSQPKQPEATGDDKAALARSYATEAITKVRAFASPQNFENWHSRNRDAVARVRDYDPALHGQLLAAIADAQRKWNPLNGG